MRRSIGKHAGMMNSLIRPVSLLALVLLLASCAGKSSEQVARNLWQGWEESDLLMQPDYPDAVPVLLVHGWNGDEFTWPNAKRLLAMEKRLGRDIYYFNYRTGALPNRYPPLEAMEEHLERYLKSFPGQVDVVAHSMGGLLVRQYLSHHAGNNVRRLLLLSVPHFGTSAASLLSELASVTATGNVQAQEIQPGSDFLWHLNSLDGSELDGIQVLNAYAISKHTLRGDLVVDPVSAWLPWAPNVVVTGDHSTLPRELDRLPFIYNFLQEGAIPAELASEPAQRNLWVRVNGHDHVPLNFTPASVKRRPGRDKHWESKGTSLCCGLRSSMYDEGATTVIAEDVHAGESLRLIDRRQTPAGVIQVDVPDELEQPVTLIERNLAGPSPVAPVEATTGE
ncbi:alpha/beta fold hydrolase [Mariprofundus ferrooxydans]|uniref:alpha/beta fold hydrolase n=1 Tax=Mariprofundus ferrooxydans TaxID=314344 RepID=UPI000559FCEF|nr:alpha/beta fold hydrolase [Mariprofundus ferrooxydans]